MGQIVFNGQKPKYANLVAITTGRKADVVLDENEIWLIDSTNAIKINGKGKYDKYIKGDGQTVAKNLPLLNVDPDVPTSLSELTDDATHRLVTDEDKQRWNSGTGGSGTPVASSEDITVINDAQESVNRLQFADKAHDSSEYSGLGKVYLRKNIQTVHTKTSEILFNALSATAIYNDAYNIAYNAKYKELIEAGTYDADGKTAANSAYTTAYNEAITAGKTTAEATKIGNAAYVKAYKAAIKGDADAESAVASVNTTSDNTGIAAGNIAWPTEYSGITAWNRKQYIDGRFTTVGNDKYINIVPQSRFSMTSVRIEVQEGEMYKIFAKKTDTAGGVDWSSRFWVITETPVSGATTAKVLQAYKIDNENFVEGQSNETVFIEVENDGVLWVNYNTYVGAVGQCKIEKISDTPNTVDINAISEINANNTEYIIQYDYDLNGTILHVPEHSVLHFEGGSIRNGYIMGNNSLIVAPKSEQILVGITLLGSFENVDFYPKWFGAVGDGVTDDTDVLQSMLDISTNIGSEVNLMWYGHKFRTTRELYIKSNTSIFGGTITAKFANQLSWVLKTYNYVQDVDKVYGTDNPGALISWQEHDGVSAQGVTGKVIKDLTIIGEYNEHLTNGQFDGTYTPIYGGLCLMATGLVTENVTIRNTGVGLGRGACLQTYDNHLNIHALFVGFAGYAINGHSIRDSYINAYCKTEESSTSTVITPYYPEYQTLVTLPKSGYVYGNGGVDMSDPDNRRPYFCNIQLFYGQSIAFEGTNSNSYEVLNSEELEDLYNENPSLVADNILVDILSEVFLCARDHTNVTLRHPWLEAVTKCLLYSTDSRVQVETPVVPVSPNDYDIIARGSVVTLISNKGEIACAGGLNGETKKYDIDNSTRVNILDARVSPYPVDDDRFYFLNNGSAAGLPASVIPSSGTGSLTNNTLNATAGTYYRFNYTVNTLVVNLPDMTGVSSIRPVMLYVETGDSPNITFTSPDNKTVTQFSNYEVDMNSKYEINCLYNGQKWVVAAAVIE